MGRMNRWVHAALAASLASLSLTGCPAPLTSPTPGGGGAGTVPLEPPPESEAGQDGARASTILNITASASHSSANYPAARAVDGNVDTEWQSGAVSGPSLLLDMGIAYSLSAIRLKTNTGFGTYSISVSTDGTTFRSVATGLSNTTWNMETKTLPTVQTARFVRLNFANAGKNVLVFEVAPVVTTTTAPAPTTNVTSTVTTRFGNQSIPRVNNSGGYDQGMALIRELGMNTIREGWNWKYIEIGNNKYVSWMSLFDDKMNRLQQAGVQVQAMITDTPDWASSDPAYRSKTTFDAASLGKYTVPAGLNLPIFADGTDTYKPGVAPNPNNYFARYVFTLATRYKGKISHYQVWNEPDFPSGDLVAGTRDANGRVRYWAGSVRDYVRLLQVAHTIVKGIDPGAKITLGGLGYASYLAAVIDNGGARYFDVVDFHAYGTEKTTSNLVLNSAWGFLGRYNALKDVLRSKGVTGKTFSCSESGFTANIPEEQASYVTKYFATSVGLGDVEMAQWAVFTNPGFLNIGLIDGATLTQKTAGYRAYVFATRQLKGAVSQGPVTGAGVQGYRLRRADGKSMYVLWSTTTSVNYTLPLASAQIFDKYGNPRTGLFSDGKLNLTLTPSPVYVVAP